MGTPFGRCGKYSASLDFGIRRDHVGKILFFILRIINPGARRGNDKIL
jgi:hypothetical protein